MCFIFNSPPFLGTVVNLVEFFVPRPYHGAVNSFDQFSSPWQRRNKTVDMNTLKSEKGEMGNETI